MLELIIFHATAIVNAIVMNPWLLAIATLIGGWAAIDYFWGKHAVRKKNQSVKNPLVIKSEKPKTNQLPQEPSKNSPNAAITEITKNEKPQKKKDVNVNRPYVSGYKHDIFVSYASVDNQDDWVTTLIDWLQERLAQKLGKNAFSLWMDDEPRDNTSITSDTTKRLEKSATLLLILSKGYLESQWCCSELEKFLAKIGKDFGRVFIVERDSVQRPEEIIKLRGYKFWEKDKTGTVHILMNPEESKYINTLNDLYGQLISKLKSLKKPDKPAPVTPSQSEVSTKNASKRIKELYKKTCAYKEDGDPEAFLWKARKTTEAVCGQIFVQKISRNIGTIKLDDFIQQLEKQKALPKHIVIPLRTIQSYGNYGVHEQGDDAEPVTMEYIQTCWNAFDTVMKWYFNTYHHQPISQPQATVFLAEVTDDLDERRNELKRSLEQHGIQILPDENYPPARYQQCLAQDLSKCDLFVQLLSDNIGEQYFRYPQIQAQIAQKTRLPILQWCTHTLDFTKIRDLPHRNFLESNTIMRTGLVEFQQAILEQLQLKTDKKRKPNNGHILVFVNAAPDDMDLAHQIKDILVEKGIGYILPLEKSTTEEQILHLKNNFLACDAVLILYDNVTPIWVRDQLLYYKNYIQRRRKSPLKLAVCNKPSQEKSSLNMKLPEMHLLECPTLQAEQGLPLFIRMLQL